MNNMSLNLEEVIKRKVYLGRVDGSSGCNGTDYQSNGPDGGGPMRQGRSFARRFNGFVPYARDSSSRICDTYDYNSRWQLRFGRSNNGVCKIVVSNLNYKVTSDDIHRIFNKFGPLKSAALRFNGYGKSLGKADVVFDNKGAATRAMRRYQNAILDGRFMRIKLATELPNTTKRFRRPTMPSFNGARGIYERDDRFLRYDGARSNNRGNPRRRNNARKMICVDELDAQLDEYMRRNNY